MTVQELIDKLQEVDNKDLEVMIEKDFLYEDYLQSVEIRGDSVLLSLY